MAIKMLVHSVMIVFLSWGLHAPAFAEGSFPVKGGSLPGIRLPIPKDSNEKKYLGLSGDGFFKIPQIKSKGVLIKIFNLYCPICQSTVATMGEIYRQIENNPDLKGKLKLIGIGTGNSPLEIEVFKENYNVPFPIFPDEDFKIHQALGEVRIPFFIAVRIEGDRPPQIVQTHLGGITDARALSDLVVEAFGMKHEDFLTTEATSSLKDLRPGVGL
ncbi:MAG: TlpA family protein disulfide reductase [Thermodesulfobacteriota bacterium]